MICRRPLIASMLVLLLQLCTVAAIKAQVVRLDYFFNREVHQVNGQVQRYHYLWEDRGNTGFSIWGDAFKRSGTRLDSLPEAPTLINLKGTAIYIIVDPDTKKESLHPNYITASDAAIIAAWVKKGGVLVMLANDSANVELPHFNLLAAKFGMHFNDDLQNHVANDNHFEDGAIDVSEVAIFKTAKKIFMKDVCSIDLSGQAKAVVTKNDVALMAVVQYGKGTVFAVGDPWLYNEYTNGRLPADYDNDKAANDISAWLLSRVRLGVK